MKDNYIDRFEDHVERRSLDESVIDSFLGLVEEVGEVGELFNRRKNPTLRSEEVRAQLLLELGDVLFYVAQIALNYGEFDLRDVIDHNIKKLDDRYK